MAEQKQLISTVAGIALLIIIGAWLLPGKSNGQHPPQHPNGPAYPQPNQHWIPPPAYQSNFLSYTGVGLIIATILLTGSFIFFVMHKFSAIDEEIRKSIEANEIRCDKLKKRIERLEAENKEYQRIRGRFK